MKDSIISIDSNIWIYALTKPQIDKPDDILKRNISLNLFENLINNNVKIIITIQIINECHVNFIKKFKITDLKAKEIIENNIIPIVYIGRLSLKTYHLGFKLRNKYNISYWDSLVAASALENNCNILYTEDMRNGQIIEEQLQIINPFKTNH